MRDKLGEGQTKIKDPLLVGFLNGNQRSVAHSKGALAAVRNTFWMRFVSLFKRGALRAVMFAVRQAGRLAPPGGEGPAALRAGSLGPGRATWRPVRGRATRVPTGGGNQAGRAKPESSPSQWGREPAWRHRLPWEGQRRASGPRVQAALPTRWRGRREPRVGMAHSLPCLLGASFCT